MVETIIGTMLPNGQEVKMRKSLYDDWDDGCYCKSCGREITTHEELKNGVCSECMKKKQDDKRRRYVRRRSEPDQDYIEEIGEEE